MGLQPWDIGQAAAASSPWQLCLAWQGPGLKFSLGTHIPAQFLHTKHCFRHLSKSLYPHFHLVTGSHPMPTPCHLCPDCPQPTSGLITAAPQHRCPQMPQTSVGTSLSGTLLRVSLTLQP